MNSIIGRFLAILILVWSANLSAQTVELGGVSNDAGGVVNFGNTDGSNNERVAMPLTLLNPVTINKIIVSLSKVGSPSDNVNMEVRQGSPDGGLLASGIVPGSSISNVSGPKYDVAVPTFTVPSGTVYVVLSRSGSSSPGNFFFAVRGSSGSAYGNNLTSGGYMYYRTGVGWGSSTLANSFIVSLWGTPVSLGQVTTSPTSLGFGDVNVGQIAQLPIQIKNTGTAVLSVSEISTSGPFTISSPTLPISVNPGDSTSAITVSFTPTSAVSVSGSVTITHNGVNSPTVVAVTGNGVVIPSGGSGSGSSDSTLVPVIGISAPGVTLVPISLNMDSVAVGAPGSYKTLEIRNDSLITLNMNNISVDGPNSGEFFVNMTSANIEAGGKRIVVVGFTPATTGLKTASIVIKHNATGGQSVVPLTGIAGPPIASVLSASVAVDPQSVTFDTTGVNSTTEREITISNSGTTSLVVGGISLGGVDPSHFSFSPSSLTVLAGSSRNVKVNFSPKSVGPKSAVLVIANNSPNSVVQVPLFGTTPIYFAPPIANMSVDKKSGPAPFTVRFSNANRGGFISRWGWNPGDGTGERVSYSNGDSLTYTYLYPGVYRPILYVDGPGGGDTQFMADSILVLVPQSLVASIRSDTDTLKMGGIDIGGSVESSFQVWNMGTAIFDGGISLDGDNSFAVVSSDSLKAVAIGGSDKRTVAVRFSPTSGGAKTARLFLRGNGDPASKMVVLMGEGKVQEVIPIPVVHKPVLLVSTNHLDLGSVIVSRGKSVLKFLVKNDGDTLLIARLFLYGNTAFSVFPDTLTLLPGKSDSVAVQFIPREAGAMTGRLYFFHNASDKPYVVDVDGEGRQFVATPAMADFDGSGVVDLYDFFLIAEKINPSSTTTLYPGEVTIFDLNGDGEVSNDDFFVFADFFGMEVDK